MMQQEEEEEALHHDNNNNNNNNDDKNNAVETIDLISMDTALERIQFGRFQIGILLASGLCFASDAMQVVLLSFLTLVLQKEEEWKLSSEQAAAITSSLFAGAVVGTLVLGPAADGHGRRPIFLVAAADISAFGLMTAFLAYNWYSIMALTFLVGLGIGGSIVPFDVLAEVLPAKGRGTYLLLIEIFWTVGVLVVVVLAYLTLHHHHHHHSDDHDHDGQSASSWRLFVALSALPCLLSVVIGYMYVPESPRWLCTQGKTEQALQIMRQAATMNGHNAQQVFPDSTGLQQEQTENKASIADLLQPKWRDTILRLWAVWGGFAYAYYGTLLVTTRVFASSSSLDNNNNNNNNNNQQASSSSSNYDFDYTAIFVSSSAELIGLTTMIFLIDRVGRIPSQVFCYLVAGVCSCLLCILSSSSSSSSSSSGDGNKSGSPRVSLIALGFLARVFLMGGTCVTWVSTAEILTTEVRSTGHSTANAIARLGAFFCPFLVSGGTSIQTIGIFLLLAHLWIVFAVYKLPETKGRAMDAAAAAAASFERHRRDDDDDDDESLLVSFLDNNNNNNRNGDGPAAADAAPISTAGAEA